MRDEKPGLSLTKDASSKIGIACRVWSADETGARAISENGWRTKMFEERGFWGRLGRRGLVELERGRAGMLQVILVSG